MNFLISILNFFNLSMTKPEMYGWFHILWLVITAAVTVVLCKCFSKGTEKQVRNIVLITAIAVIILEIYKQINVGAEQCGECADVTV